MLKEKTVKVFDANKNKRGDFITFCHTRTSSDKESVDGDWVNGLIDDISEHVIDVITIEGTEYINLNDIIDDIVRIKR